MNMPRHIRRKAAHTEASGVAPGPGTLISGDALMARASGQPARFSERAGL